MVNCNSKVKTTQIPNTIDYTDVLLVGIYPANEIYAQNPAYFISYVQHKQKLHESVNKVYQIS